MILKKSFWKGKKVFLTGHTGFKGGWMSIFLSHLGAEVLGFSLKAQKKSFFNQVKLGSFLHHNEGDIRDLSSLRKVEKKFKPEILIHMAAQPLVIESYEDPVTTYSTNVMGTVNILELIRNSSSLKAGVIITTDKCYENRGLSRGYKETDRMGGYDPYSSSKGSAELIINSYQRSFFSKKQNKKGSTCIASVRAGNVIGGGDWAEDRLIPDLVRAAEKREGVKIRNPDAIRPWQHVIEPLLGYLLVAEKLYNKGPSGSDNWNFGPKRKDLAKVSEVADLFCSYWGDNLSWLKDSSSIYHEADNLSLNIKKARETLGWVPKWTLAYAIKKTVEWHRKKLSSRELFNLSVNQIKEYLQNN